MVWLILVKVGAGQGWLRSVWVGSALVRAIGTGLSIFGAGQGWSGLVQTGSSLIRDGWNQSV